MILKDEKHIKEIPMKLRGLIEEEKIKISIKNE